MHAFAYGHNTTKVETCPKEENGSVGVVSISLYLHNIYYYIHHLLMAIHYIHHLLMITAPSSYVTPICKPTTVSLVIVFIFGFVLYV